MVYPALLLLMRIPRLPVAPTDLKVCFTERRNLVSAHVPSHFKCSLTYMLDVQLFFKVEPITHHEHVLYQL